MKAPNFDIVEGTSQRLDCPECGGSNTLSVSKLNGKVAYMCHRATCDLRGYVDGQFTVDDLIARDHKPKPKTIPDFVSVWNHCNAVGWLYRFGCAEWMKHNDHLIRYDPKQDRVVFLIEHSGTIIDAVGAYLGNQMGVAKWYRYGNSGEPFVAKYRAADRTCVVVEDAASACSVSRIGFDGVALLGVNVTKQAMITIGKYDKAIIALDRDALARTIQATKELGQVCDTEIMVLDKDLKYYSRTELEQMFRS